MDNTLRKSQMTKQLRHFFYWKWFMKTGVGSMFPEEERFTGAPHHQAHWGAGGVRLYASLVAYNLFIATVKLLRVRYGVALCCVWAIDEPNLPPGHSVYIVI